MYGKWVIIKNKWKIMQYVNWNVKIRKKLINSKRLKIKKLITYKYKNRKK